MLTRRNIWSHSPVLDNHPLFCNSPQELPPHSPSLTPSSKQFFGGERFTIRCPAPLTNSSAWRLAHFSASEKVRKSVQNDTNWCTGAHKSDACTLTAGGRNSGMYWCEGVKGRSSAVNVTISCEFKGRWLDNFEWVWCKLTTFLPYLPHRWLHHPEDTSLPCCWGWQCGFML